MGTYDILGFYLLFSGRGLVVLLVLDVLAGHCHLSLWRISRIFSSRCGSLLFRGPLLLGHLDLLYFVKPPVLQVRLREREDFLTITDRSGGRSSLFCLGRWRVFERPWGSRGLVLESCRPVRRLYSFVISHLLGITVYTLFRCSLEKFLAINQGGGGLIMGVVWLVPAKPGVRLAVARLRHLKPSFYFPLQQPIIESRRRPRRR